MGRLGLDPRPAPRILPKCESEAKRGTGSAAQRRGLPRFRRAADAGEWGRPRPPRRQAGPRWPWRCFCPWPSASAPPPRDPVDVRRRRRSRRAPARRRPPRPALGPWFVDRARDYGLDVVTRCGSPDKPSVLDSLGIGRRPVRLRRRRRPRPLRRRRQRGRRRAGRPRRGPLAVPQRRPGALGRRHGAARASPIPGGPRRWPWPTTTPTATSTCSSPSTAPTPSGRTRATARSAT